MRALCLDLGQKRIGVAVSNTNGTLATPVETIIRQDPQATHRAIFALIDEFDVEILVIGLPLLLNGDAGPAAQGAREEAARIQEQITIPVVFHDERNSTITAAAALHESGLTARKQKSVIDKMAAAVILQNWLETNQHSAASEETHVDAKGELR